MHYELLSPLGKATKLNLELEGQVAQALLSYLDLQVSQVEWQKLTSTQSVEPSVNPLGQSATQVLELSSL